jgi:hypothetical protein
MRLEHRLLLSTSLAGQPDLPDDDGNDDGKK